MTDPTPLWQGPALLVPMTVDALVLTQGSYIDTVDPSGKKLVAWAWSEADYTLLADFQSPSTPMTHPRILSPKTPADGKFYGVLLHWALPDGLTHGVQGPDGAMVYPALPNRWLVVRKARNASVPATWAYEASIVASDYTPGTGSSFPTFGTDAWGNSTFGGAPVGASWPLASWGGEAAMQGHGLTPPLTAIAPGDPTFSAYAPNAQSLLTFADALADVAPGSLSYSVYGWYADPTQDPLLGAREFGPSGWQSVDQWQALMQRFGWTVGEDGDPTEAIAAACQWATAHGFSADPASPRSVYPSRTLCHGLLSDVFWPGKAAPHLSGKPPVSSQAADYVRPQVAIGHSSIDALATLIAQSSQGSGGDAVHTLTNILEAFQYDNLAVLDGTNPLAQLSLLKQQGWYSASAGGTSWSVVADAEAASPTPQAPAPALSADERAALTRLNILQGRLDACERRLAACQAELYALWWKFQNLNNAPLVPPLSPDLQNLLDNVLPGAIADAKQAVTDELARHAVVRAQRDGAFGPLQAGLVGARLVSSAAAPFYRPNEPVVLITGTGRAYKHGEDGRFDEGGALGCRFTGQTLDALSLTLAGKTVTVTASQAALPSWQQADLPLEVADLDAESYFLDLTNAPVIAALANPSAPWDALEPVRLAQTVVWNAAAHPPLAAAELAAQAGLLGTGGQGVWPSKVAVENWSAPWSPLFLDWTLDYQPGAASPAQAFANWAFPAAEASGTDDDFTYRWKSSAPAPSGLVTLSGRTLLTPQATGVFAARLERMIEQGGQSPDAQADMWALQEALDYMANADLLSQALSGFNAALLEQVPQVFSPSRYPDVAPYFAPATGPAWQPEAIPSPGAVESQFNPIRGGFFRLRSLNVVDGFGQAFDVLEAMQGTQPVPATDLGTPGAASPQSFELKPRFTQDSRLGFDFLDADDDTRTVGVDADADPVCGWLIVNRLDESAMVYGRDGTMLGQLIVTEGAARWQPPPDAAPSTAALQPPALANRHLQAWVTSLLAAPASDVALAGLLRLIDESAWAIDPTGGWADEELPLLVGRPLAIVRARLHFELKGAPATSQAWDDTATGATGGFETARFAVQLGSSELLDDGLVGYYLNDDYGSIQSAYTLSTPCAYVGTRWPSLAAKGTDAALLTLVLNPQSQLHALSGLLPPLKTRLPAAFAEPDLAKMELTFRAGPVLADPAAFAMPLPALSEGRWAWLQYPSTTAVAQPSGVAPADALARLPDRPAALREGWLQLRLGAASTKLTYAIAPESVPCAQPQRPSAVLLRFTAYNGSGSDVACSQITLKLPVGPDAASLTTRPDLVVPSLPKDAKWTVQADGAGSFTLTPQDAAVVVAAGETLCLTLADVQVNAAPGRAALSLSEACADGTGDAVLSLVKLPPAPPPVVS